MAKKKQKVRSGSILLKLLETIPLESSLKVALQMDDYGNWKNGEYFGDREKLVPLILKKVEKWLEKENAPLRYNKKD